MQRLKGVAKGRVQGVGFRYFVMQHATELEITGWIKNMEDGTVDMEMQGTETALAKLVTIIEKGNFIIKVEELSLEEIPVVEENAFIIKH